MENLNSINKACQHYRVSVLGLTLKEMSSLTGLNIKTISAFENERSTNMNHLFSYASIGTEQQKIEFINQLTSIIKGV